MQELLVDIDDLDALYRCYMPYLQTGGLFVCTNKCYEIGQVLALRVILPKALNDDVVIGKVAWITPHNAQSANPPGIGVSFDDDSELKTKIEKLLGTMLKSDNPTYTM